MNDATSALKTCDVCGDPIRPDNTYGVCSKSPKAACRKELGRRRRARHPQEAPKRPRTRQCEVCGKLLNNNNRSGLCDGKDSPPCVKERARRLAERRKSNVKADSRADSPKCEVCGSKINRSNKYGVCGDPWKAECRRERKRRKALGLIPGPSGLPIVAGDTFGRWTALEDARIETMFILCRCQCGSPERRIFGRNLILKISKDCGCAYRKAGIKKRFPDPYLRAGFVSGRLTLLEDVWRSHDGARCRCACGPGEVAVTHPQNLKNGTTKSCGCLKREGQTTHGLSSHPLFGTWRGIIDRCTNSKNPNWRSYGGRRKPVRVCDRWMDPAAFIEDVEREIGPRPEGRYPTGVPLYTLDRVNNDGHYEPGNVKWSTQSEQVLNQRKVDSLTDQRDAALAEVDRLTRLLATRSCSSPAMHAIQDAPF